MNDVKPVIQLKDRIIHLKQCTGCVNFALTGRVEPLIDVGEDVLETPAVEGGRGRDQPEEGRR
jgi:hypothetical protein